MHTVHKFQILKLIVCCLPIHHLNKLVIYLIIYFFLHYLLVLFLISVSLSGFVLRKDTSCYGHGQNDLLDFSNFLGNDDTYTNIGFYDFIHPWNNNLPYTYDTYDFDYCVQQGVEITYADNY